ncbi:HD domain-containing protein [Xylanibacillus composti]|uniref:C-di-GMP phosphodiesterase n=1 Tax=Xylanibacillus composti TaxID=1572762 RepID=A0A8J4H544_9BACL|nr:HD domain-containing phosphohydrolase [Xylanibacillus composti]MDT9724826.1 HD domain-containing protein [Xylanibacillus composti]GIQ69821.1 c-di-GMP phosphodiesterase [Xylanibacillus composti]
MIKVSVHQLREGDKLAESIVTHNGTVMLSGGTILTKHYIKRLIERGISDVYVDCEPEPEASMKEARIKPLRHRKENIINVIIHKLEHPSISIFPFHARKESAFKRIYRKTMLDISHEPMVVELLNQLHESEPSLLEHCVNVSILSGMIGTEYGFDNAGMLELLIGSLLYDIGMLKVPASILRSDKHLTGKQRELLTHHTVDGYHMLRNINGVPERSALCALLHHEKFDGSGYPYRLTGKDIPCYAQIVGIADLYDALISPKPYRSPYKAVDAIELFYAAGNHYFRADLVNIFLKLINVYPVTHVIRLSNGQTGIVKSYSPSIVHRPAGGICREEDRSSIASSLDFDLAQTRNDTDLHEDRRIESKLTAKEHLGRD